MKKIKVLVVSATMDVGGIENQLMHLLRNADKEKFQIDFTTCMEHPFYEEEILSLGGKCIHICNTEGKHFFRYCKELYNVLHGEYDIVHSHELFHSGLVLLTAKLAGVKSRIVHAHNISDADDNDSHPSIVRKIYNFVMRKLILRYATQFCACSSPAGEFLYGKEITKKENYNLIFNSVDVSKFVVSKENGNCDDWANVLQVGRFTEVKNQLFSVEIANEFKKANKKVRILCVGNNGNDYEQEVKNKISEYGVSEYIQLLGVRKDIPAIMAKCKAFLLPSLYEGMPLVLLEAQTVGLNSVVADTFSHEVDFGIGLIEWVSLDCGSKAWAEKIVEAIESEPADNTDIMNAIKKYGFDSRSFCEKICRIYEKEHHRFI